MISAADERIALVISTDAKLEGILAARAGMKSLGGQIQETSGHIDKMSPRMRTAANAAATLAFSLQGGTGSAQSMAIMAGTLTSSLATLATTARVAAAASGIGALVVVLATVIGFFTKAGAEAKKAGEEFEKSLTPLHVRAMLRAS